MITLAKPRPPPRLRLRANRGGVFVCRPDWSMDLGPLSDFDLWAVFDGHGELRGPEGTFAVGAGDVFLLRPGGRYRGRHDPQRPLTVVALHFDWLGASGRPQRPRPLPAFHRRLGATAFFRELLERSVQARQAEDAAGAAAWLGAVLLELAREDSRSHVHAAGAADEQARALARLGDEIRRNPVGAGTVEEMAAGFGVTPDHFTRLFRQAHGVTPREFVIRARIEAARGLLLETGYAVGRIAALLGYRNIHYFSRQFREETGTAPRAFRRNGACPGPGRKTRGPI